MRGRAIVCLHRHLTFNLLFPSSLHFPSCSLFFAGANKVCGEDEAKFLLIASGQCRGVSTEGSSSFISRDLQVAPLLQMGFGFFP